MSNYRDQDQFEEKVVRVSRVSTKTKGGDQFGFTVMMVVGDRKGRVGVGLGKAQDVVSAIRKGVRRAKKQMIDVPIAGTTIPFAMDAKEGAGRVLLKPASEGSGVIAGGPVRAVCEAAGIKDISAKILGSDNQASSVLATIKAFKKMNKIIKVRGIEVEAKQEEESKPQPSEKKAKKAKKKSKKSAKKKSGSKSKGKSKTKAKTTKKKSKQSKAESKSSKKSKQDKKDKTEKSKSKQDQKKNTDQSKKESKKTKKTKADQPKKKSSKAKSKSAKEKAKKSSSDNKEKKADKKSSKKDK